MPTIERQKLEEEVIGITSDAGLLGHYLHLCLNDIYQKYTHSLRLPKHTQTIFAFAPGEFTDGKPMKRPLFPGELGSELAQRASRFDTILLRPQPSETMRGWTIKRAFSENGLPIVAAEATWVPQ